MTANRPSPDVAIIGAGIVGTALAGFLAEAGRSVRLYERTAIAAGASGRNSGIVQHPFDPVLAALYESTLRELRDLGRESGSAFTIADEAAGLLLVGRDGRLAAAAADAWSERWPAAEAEVVAGVSLERLEATVAPDLVACRLAIGFPVAPAGATGAFADLARRLGVEIEIGLEARPVKRDGRVVGVDVGGHFEPAGAVVVAAGPWTPALVDASGGWRPIRPMWGVVASVQLADAPRHGLEAIDIDIEPEADTGAETAAEPRADPAGDDVPEPGDALVDFSLVPGSGSSALGSTFLPLEPDPAAWLPALRRVGSRYVPAVADAPLVGIRHCARPVSADGRPLVGPVPWCDGLWIAAGHGPWGISTGAGTARLLADRMLGRVGDAAIPPVLSVGRFGGPDQRQDSGLIR